jgi:hypothetical protein
MRMCQVFCGKIGLVDHCVDLGGERVEGVAEGGLRSIGGGQSGGQAGTQEAIVGSGKKTGRRAGPQGPDGRRALSNRKGPRTSRWALSATRGASDSGVVALASARKVAMASSSLRRSPTNPTPRSFKSSAVSLDEGIESFLPIRTANDRAGGFLNDALRRRQRWPESFPHLLQRSSRGLNL